MVPACAADADCNVAGQVCNNPGLANAACGMYSYSNSIMRKKVLMWKLDETVVIIILKVIILVIIL